VAALYERRSAVLSRQASTAATARQMGHHRPPSAATFAASEPIY